MFILYWCLICGLRYEPNSLYASNASPFAEQMQRAETCDLYACIGVCVLLWLVDMRYICYICELLRARETHRNVRRASENLLSVSYTWRSPSFAEEVQRADITWKFDHIGDCYMQSHLPLSPCSWDKAMFLSAPSTAQWAVNWDATSTISPLLHNSCTLVSSLFKASIVRMGLI